MLSNGSKCGCLHIPEKKTNNKRNISMGISQIQKATNSLMIQSGIYFKCSTSGIKFNSILERIWGWFTIFHMKAPKKVTYILRMGKGNSLLGLEYLEGKNQLGLSCWNIKSRWFIILLLESIGWAVDLHLETVGRAID
jgi:hypothetical protein